MSPAQATMRAATLHALLLRLCPSVRRKLTARIDWMDHMPIVLLAALSVPAKGGA